MVGEQEEDAVQRHLDKKADLKLQAKSDMSPLSLVVMMSLVTTKATAIPNSR